MAGSSEEWTGGPGGFDGTTAVAEVTAKRVSVADLVADAERRAAEWEPELGAIVTVVARDGAPTGPLNGLIVGVKDLVAISGVPRLCGAPELVDASPQLTDSPVVARLLDAGVHLHATLQTQPLAFGVVTPQTRNPRAADRIAGGSSGGSAAAVAAGMVHAAVGSDTGGSIRIPAACCGVVGFKPTFGIVPVTGVQPLAWSFDTVGTLAASVADAAMLLWPMVGPDSEDPGSVADARHPAVDRPLRFGIPRELSNIPVDEEIRRVFAAVVERIADSHHRLVEVELPLLPDVPHAHGRIISAEAAEVHRKVLRDRPGELPGPSIARFAYGQGLTGVEVVAAQRAGREFAMQFAALAGTADVLLLPTLPTRVPGVGADRVKVAGSEESTTIALTRLVNPWNLVGAPAGSIPAGCDTDGGPVGIQVVGQVGHDRTVLRAMSLVEELLGGPWATVPPPVPA